MAQEDTRDPLAKKTKVSVGSKIDNEFFSFELVDCSVKKAIQATDLENSQQYSPMSKGKAFIHALVKIKNKAHYPLKGVTTYTIVDGTGIRGDSKKEIANNTKLDGLLDSPLEIGEEEYCHLYAIVDENVDTAQLKLRFNLGGVCYYCEPA